METSGNPPSHPSMDFLLSTPIHATAFLRSLKGLSPSVSRWNAALEKACIRFLLQSTLHSSSLLAIVSRQWGIQRAYNLLLRAEIVSGIRTRPQVTIFDHTFHLVGGGQKYGCTIAHVLKTTCDVTLLTHRPIRRESLEDWYALDLSGCTIQSISIPFFERENYTQIDPGVITVHQENPFHPIALVGGLADVFINNSMLEMVFPLANVSVMVCHFPERRKSSFFYADRYEHVIYNSEYTAEWIRRKWGFPPTTHIFPPADMEGSDETAPKEKIILSVARFETGGSKQQDRMVDIFSRLRALAPRRMNGWKLVLAGGSLEINPFLDRIRSRLQNEPELPVEIKVNVPAVELKTLYEKARIFWHLCGLNQTDPSRVEHFGMTIVEAMQNGCVPIVFDGGGQREIVEHGISGFRFANRQSLIAQTQALVNDPPLLEQMAGDAYRRSRLFSRQAFEDRVRHFFNPILASYSTLP